MIMDPAGAGINFCGMIVVVSINVEFEHSVSFK